MIKVTLFLSMLVALCGAQTFVSAQEASVKKYGAFSNVRTSGEHASGYSLDLWTHGKTMIGVIRIHRGLAGDPPAGLLENVAYNSRTHKLSFTAKASIGSFSDKDHDQVPSQDALSFNGTVTTRAVNGSLSTKNLLCNKGCAERITITLRKSAEWSKFQKSFPSLAAWQDDIKTIMDVYGPKW